MSDPSPAACEICGEGPVEKVLHPVPVFFKGSGFYSTDYGRKGKRRDSTDGDSPAKKDEPAKTADEKKPAAEKT
jgi:predicted nucleic acid-binding Zn ribbon protein